MCVCVSVWLCECVNLMRLFLLLHPRGQFYPDQNPTKLYKQSGKSKEIKEKRELMNHNFTSKKLIKLKRDETEYIIRDRF